MNKKKLLSYSAPVWRILIIAASLAVIAFLWAVTISPIEFVRFERDRQRVRDAHTLTEILEKIEKQSPRAFRGKQNIVYVSLPDSDLNCSHWNLPPLADGYAYRCVPFTDYRQVNGAGWLPVDFTVFTEKSLSSLPVDPLNGRKGKDPISGKNKLFFYQYMQGSFALVLKAETPRALSDLSAAAGLNRSKSLSKFINKQPRGLQMELFNNNNFIVGTGIRSYMESLPEPKRREFISGMEKNIEFHIRNLIQSADRESDEFNKTKQAAELSSSFINWRFEEPAILPLKTEVEPAKPKPSAVRPPLPLPAPIAISTDGVFQDFYDFINKSPAADLEDDLAVKREERTFAEMAEELEKQKPELRREFLQLAWQGFCQSRDKEFNPAGPNGPCCR